MDLVKAGRFPSKNQSFWRLMGKRDKKRMQQSISKLCLAKCFNLSREVFDLVNEKPMKFNEVEKLL